MGPPPPPPPPPPLGSSTTLPSRRWKTEDAPRRNNNPVPSPPKQARPTVDPAALQHAAARLRKTGYNEPVRGDIENLSDGRVDRSDQRLFDGDRTYRAHIQQLDFDQTREQIPSPATHPNTSRPIGNIHRHPMAINSNFTTSPSREAPSSTNSFSSSTLKQFNNSPSPSIKTNENNNSQEYSIAPESTYISPYSTKYSYPTNFRSYHKDDDYFATTNTQQNENNNTTTTKPNSKMSLSPSPPIYSNPSTFRRSNSPSTTTYSTTTTAPIRNAREMIHEYSTTNYVIDTPSLPPSNDNFKKAQARNFLQSSLAQQLRDEGLTESQKAANRFQKTSSATSSSSPLPFNPSKIVQDSYNGDEVDHLVHQMRNNLSGGSSNSNYSQLQPSVLQYPRQDLNQQQNQKTHYNTTTHTTTSSRKIMNINICVGCGKEITADQPGCNAMNQIFHVDCFNCGKCKRTLAGSSFYNIDDKPTCEACYQDSLEKCTACHRSIDDKLLRACGGVYHVSCFVCFSCKKSLDGIPFTLDKDNNVHCVPCFHDKFAPRCALCSRPIVPQEGEKESVRVVAMDKSFHVDCYKCEDCGMQLSSKLEGQGCYPIDQHLLCKTCNGNRLRVASTA